MSTLSQVAGSNPAKLLADAQQLMLTSFSIEALKVACDSLSWLIEGTLAKQRCIAWMPLT